MRAKNTLPNDDRIAIPPLGRTLEFLRLIWSVDHRLHRVSKRMQSRLGITGPQRLALRILGRVPGVTAGQLAEILHLHPSTLTGILARLEERGLVTRRTSAYDRRRVSLELTERGREIEKQSAGTVENAVERTLAELGDAEASAARRALMLLVRVLDRSIQIG